MNYFNDALLKLENENKRLQERIAILELTPLEAEEKIKQLESEKSAAKKECHRMELLYADYRDSVARRRWFVVLTILALSAFTLYTLFGLGEWKDEIYSKGYSDGIAFQKTVDENKGTLNGSNTDTPSRTTGNNGSTAGKTSSGGTPRPKDNQFPEGVIYIGNKNTKKYHETTCSYLPDEENMVYIYSVAQTAGYTPCGRCKP